MGKPKRKTSPPDIPPARLAVESALLGVLLFHAFLLYGFRLAPPKSVARAGRDTTHCVLLAPEKKARAEERALWAWYYLADPSIFTLPNEEIGFSRVRNERPKLPYTPPPPYQYIIAYQPEFPLPMPPLASPWPPPADAVAADWPAPRIPPLGDPSLGSVPQHAIVWHCPDGRRIPDPPDLPEDKAADLVNANLHDLVHPTRIEILHTAQRIRIVLRRSCGNAALDALAVDALIRQAGEIQRRLAATPEAGRPSWFPDKGDERTVEIEWRLLAAAPPGAG